MSPVTKNVQKKDANWLLERRLTAGVPDEMINEVNESTIQSDEQVNTIIDSKEHVDARNWLRNDSAEQVDAINDSEKFVVDGSDSKSDLSIATQTTDGTSATDTPDGTPTQRLFLLLKKSPLKLRTSIRVKW